MTYRWLLDLDLDGATYRWAVEPLDVATAAGDTLTYVAGLDPISAARGDDTIAVSVTDPDVDWPALAIVAEGARCTLRRWRVGTVFEAAEVFITGRASLVEHGTRDEPVAWTIDAVDRRRYDLGRQLPDPTARVDETTWPAVEVVTTNPIIVPEASIGRAYPIVFGYPGYDPDSPHAIAAMPVPHGQIVTAAAGSYVGDQYVVVSEDPAAPITSVRVNDLVSRGVETCPVVPIVDLLGRTVLCAEIVGTTNPDVWLFSEYDDADPHVGFTPLTGGGVERDAYGVLTYLLRRWGAPDATDWDRMPEIRDTLGSFFVDSYIDEVVEDPWAWFEDALLPDLPVRIATSTRGRYLVPLRYRPDARRVRGAIRADTGAVRESPVTTSWGGRNEFVALYGWQPSSESWRRRVVLTAASTVLGAYETPPTGLTDIVAGHRGCALSQARHGVRQGDVLEIDWTWDAGTVLAVLGWMADRDALTTRTVQYTIPEDDRLEEGDTITVTDDEVGLDEAIGIVEGAPLVHEDGVTVTVRIPEVS